MRELGQRDMNWSSCLFDNHSSEGGDYQYSSIIPHMHESSPTIAPFDICLLLFAAREEEVRAEGDCIRNSIQDTQYRDDSGRTVEWHTASCVSPSTTGLCQQHDGVAFQLCGCDGIESSVSV